MRLDNLNRGGPKQVFQKVQQLVAQFAPTCAMTDFEEALAAGFQHVYPNASEGLIGSTITKAYNNYVMHYLAKKHHKTLRRYTIIRTDDEED